MEGVIAIIAFLLMAYCFYKVRKKYRARTSGDELVSSFDLLKLKKDEVRWLLFIPLIFILAIIAIGIIR